MPDTSSILMLALGMLARDPKADLAAPQREAIMRRLRAAHALNMPLALSTEERHEYTQPLLSYIAIHRPRILQVVMRYLEEVR